MNCRKCGAQVDTRRKRSDGSVQCPKCKTIYRPRTTSPAPIQKKKKPGSNSFLRKIPWKKKYWKLPVWGWCCIALVLLIGAIGSSGNNSTASTTVIQPTVIPSTEPVATEVVTASPEPVATDAPVSGDPFERVADEVISRAHTFEHRGENDIYIRFLIDGLNEEWTIKDFKMGVTNYVKTLATKYPELSYGTAYFVGYCATVNVYGEKGFQDAIRLAVDKTEVDRIVWENFIWENIDKIGHDYTVGAILQK